jgi:50S ribosomal protein L16 3-hydroxylase
VIEVHARRAQPLGMSPARFLREYWQKRPLLIRGAFPHFHNALTPEDLAGLACEEAALARIVLHDRKHDRFTLRNGPLAERDFAKLPKTHWTLLVQDVDKWDMDVARLLDEFTFIPAWRIDDVMVSYATDGGGVGAHVDEYDVFLVQGRGERRWRISVDPRAPKAFRDDTELKLLREFTPTHEWILAPGDALYLPPGVPHEGTALGNCMTFSVGMRAPSHAELLLDFAEALAEPLGEEQRYRDPDLHVPRDASEIDAAAVARAARALERLRTLDKAAFADWFGSFITRYRSAQVAVQRRRVWSAAQIAKALHGATLLRHPWSRLAWRRSGRDAVLFVAGERYTCTAALARALCARREIDGAELARPCRSKSDRETLAALLNAGHLHLAARR